MHQLPPTRVLILALGFPLYALEVTTDWVWNGMKDAVRGWSDVGYGGAV